MNFEEFWTRGDVHERVKIALKEANLLEKKLEIEDLFPLDQYHARGIAATIELADKLNFSKNSTIIDIGCGLGGPARYFSKRFNCNVYGIDITEAFIEIGNFFIFLISIILEFIFFLCLVNISIWLKDMYLSPHKGSDNFFFTK